ncbi:rod shape-determining protein MreC [Altererythrobacter sp. MF3-039]|uniref:rod shape-determining protein MreC n=1 Tax=Altererythrobacter sp. MF3-039 TaxID=3252901 RepID=UPI00390CD83E
MAPPASRRSSFSRKAQYSVFTGYVVAGIGALIGAILLGISLFWPSSFSGLRGPAQDAVEPLGETSAEVRTESQGFFESIAGFYRAGSQNAELRNEMELARIRLAEAEAVRQENERLKGLLGFQNEDIEPVAVGRLTGSTASSARRFAYLGIGKNDGIDIGMPVRSPRGIVGRILEVSVDSSRVLLLTDSESVLPVRRATDELVAFAEGRGDGMLRIRLINLGINPLEPGDVFVTSGAGGYYRPGIAVAIVAEVTDDGALARIISDPAATDWVSVEPIFEPQAVLAGETPPEIELAP